MKSLKSSNFWVQLITLILGAFVLGGLNLNVPVEELSADIVNGFVDDNYLSLMTIFVINLLNPLYHWIKTLKTNPKQFWAFVHSVNFWVSAGNVTIAGLLLFFPIEIPADAIPEIVDAVMSQQWMELIPLLVVNIIVPILKYWFKKKPIEIEVG